MRNYGLNIYLNGIAMTGSREPPIANANGFIEMVMKDLLSNNEPKKHKCSPDCKSMWTICIGSDFTAKKTFLECVPR